jgi:hypothetical protein
MRGNSTGGPQQKFEHFPHQPHAMRRCPAGLGPPGFFRAAGGGRATGGGRADGRREGAATDVAAHGARRAGTGVATNLELTSVRLVAGMVAGMWITRG